jgi:ribonucleoside-diphosphate reductase alpha chain
MLETHKIAKTLGWQVEIDYPVWGNNSLYLTTIKGGYLLENETPKNAYTRLSKRASELLNKPELEERFFDILWKGYLIPSTPVFANLGSNVGLPVSCYSSYIGDDLYEIGRKAVELMMLSKMGGGTAYDFSEIRPIGSPIKNGEYGTSDGIIPFIKTFDSAIMACKQGKLRRGATAIYLDVNHKEIEEFLRIRQSSQEDARRCLNIHQGVKFDDNYMNRLTNKDGKAISTWKNLLKARIETGEPYLFFTDNANRNLPENWKKNSLLVRQSNLCNEIMLPTDENTSLTCVLSTLNLAKFEEFRHTDTVFLSTLFLDAVVEDFIQKAEKIKGIEDTVKFAKKGRALGLGVQAWHTFLQSKNLPFIGIASNSWTNIIFSHIKSEAERATEWLAKEYGEPEWMEGTGKRNLTLLTIPPTRSSSKLSGGVSQGIEPINANIYLDDDAKGNHIKRNTHLEILLEEKGMNTNDVWDNINEYDGSVQHLDFLSKDEKDVYLTFREINQLELVKQAGLRQKYICQGQSLNLAFFQDASAKWINKVHLTAWEVGLKGLYYLKSKSTLKVSTTSQRDLYSECLACEA